MGKRKKKKKEEEEKSTAEETFTRTGGWVFLLSTVKCTGLNFALMNRKERR